MTDVYKSMYVSGNAETGEVFLTSGFQPPFEEQDLLKQIDATCHFQSYATGGAILHLFLGEQVSSINKLRKLVKHVTNVPVQYFTITPTLSVCNECGFRKVGKMVNCSNCGSDDVSFYIRPIGYFRPVMRKKIKEDLSGAEHEFSTRARIRDYSLRKYVFEDDIDSLLNEVTMF